MDWNAEAIERLKLLWTEGLPTAEIGRRLNISKNAVVGKAHRLALVARPSPIRRDPDAAPRARHPVTRRAQGPTLPPLSSAAEAPPAPEARMAEPIALPIALDDAAAGQHHPSHDTFLAGPDGDGPRPAMESAPSRSGPAASLAASLAADLERPVVPPAARQTEADAAPLSLVPVTRAMPAPRASQRNAACCWPIGEPGTPSFHFCGKAAATGRPYCEAHAEIAYVRVRDRRDNAA
jgi:GcrA cell cycle regulator